MFTSFFVSWSKLHFDNTLMVTLDLRGGKVKIVGAIMSDDIFFKIKDILLLKSLSMTPGLSITRMHIGATTMS